MRIIRERVSLLLFLRARTHDSCDSTKGYYLHWDGSEWERAPWARDHKWSRVCPFTGKDFLERHNVVLALESLRISSTYNYYGYNGTFGG
jgi:hypothetical protein